jgi:hypothetical protein
MQREPNHQTADDKIKDIARQASDSLYTKIIDASAKLQTAIAEHEEANQDNETPKTFNLGFIIKLDWAGNKAIYTLGFSTRYKDETAETLPDSSQPELFQDDEGGEK